MEHLNLTATQYLDLWTVLMNEPAVRDGTTYAFWWRWFLSRIANPAQLRAKTPSSLEPANRRELQSAIAEYLPVRQRVYEVASQLQ